MRWSPARLRLSGERGAFVAGGISSDCGTWGVHYTSKLFEDGWRLSHLPTGFAVARYRRKAEAKATAEVLGVIPGDYTFGELPACDSPIRADEVRSIVFRRGTSLMGPWPDEGEEPKP